MKSPAESNTVTGKVNTQARSRLRTVWPWTPDLLANIPPAIPDERQWVVLTGTPAMADTAMVLMATSSEIAPCP